MADPDKSKSQIDDETENAKKLVDPGSFSDDEIEHLSDEELEALGLKEDDDDEEDPDKEEEDDDDDELEEEEDEEDPKKKESEDDEDPDEEEEEDSDSDDDDKEEDDDDADPDEEEEEDPDEEEEEDQPADTGARPIHHNIDTEQVKKAQTVLKGIDAKYDAIEKQLADGDIDDREARKQTRELDKTRRGAERIVDRAELLQEINAGNTSGTFEQAQNRFFAKPENKFYLADNDAGDRNFKKLQAQLTGVTQDPDFQNASYDQIIAEADKRFRQNTGYTGSPTDSKTKKNTAKKKTAAKKEISKRRAKKKGVQTKLKKSLADKTSASTSDNKDKPGKFAHLDELEGMDLETELSKLSPADQRRWLES